MGEQARALPERDRQAIAFIEQGLAENKTIKQILSELHAQAPYNSWGRPGVEKQWVQVWRPALLAMGKAPPRVLRQLAVRQAAAPAPGSAAGSAARTASAGEKLAGSSGTGAAPAAPAVPGAAGMAAVVELRSLLRPLAEVALGQAPEPARCLEAYARAQLLLDDIGAELRARAQELQEKAEELRAARQRPAPGRSPLEVMHKALEEVLGREGGPSPEEVLEVAGLVHTRLGQLLKQL